MNIELTFRNQSDASKVMDVVIFQKNLAADHMARTLAWQVIKECGPDQFHPFTYSMGLQASALDNFGNQFYPMDVSPGQQLAIIHGSLSNDLTITGPSADPHQIEILNSRDKGSVNGLIVRGGYRLAEQTAISPGEKAIFEFEDTLWIGVTEKIEQGQVLDHDLVDSIETELPLVNIASADIIMQGGGDQSTPFTFKLDNVVTR
ncbi:hypothetical protein ACR9YC_03240 [Parasphingorhabdus sp. DH2-15]|uniref:hypothetical protein n=1 Tax=Parasphingorhabdus sp. DH2-15 TaxID=3444112 RepID=UPI003F687A93